MAAENPAPMIDLASLDQLWFQVAGTRCNLTCHHCFISCSPKNDSFGFLSLHDVQRRLEESVSHGVREYYFTGGEPFLNPEMTEILIAALQFGPATVLTNATVLKDDWLKRLAQAEQGSRFSLEFRVSIDGFSSETNDPIRGEGTFDRALAGIIKLVEHGFLPIITAARTWPEEEDARVIGEFTAMLRREGYCRPRLKLLPVLQLGAEEQRTCGYRESERITAAMMVDFDRSQLLCHSARVVTDRGVCVCPILIESPDALLGDSLEASKKPFEMRHGACYTCYQYGSICANPSTSATSTTQSRSSH